MRIRGVLLGTVEEQIKGGDEHPIDPERVELFEDGHVPIMREFDYTRTLGVVDRIWREGGRLMFEAELPGDEPKDAPLAAIGISGDEVFKVFSVGLTDANENRDQPPWEAIDG